MRAAHVVFVVMLLLTPTIAAAGSAVPPDFSLRAEYYPPLPDSELPGSGRLYPWTTHVTAEGRAHQESNRTVPGKRRILRRSLKVARQDLEALVAEIRRAKFHTLAPEYAFEVSPHATLVLRITLDGHSHDVTVYGPERIKDDPDVAAFLRVWNRAMKAAPPPGPRSQ